jgi:hypothetical protein
MCSTPLATYSAGSRKAGISRCSSPASTFAALNGTSSCPDHPRLFASKQRRAVGGILPRAAVSAPASTGRPDRATLARVRSLLAEFLAGPMPWNVQLDSLGSSPKTTAQPKLNGPVIASTRRTEIAVHRENPVPLSFAVLSDSIMSVRRPATHLFRSASEEPIQFSPSIGR